MKEIFRKAGIVMMLLLPLILMSCDWGNEELPSDGDSLSFTITYDANGADSGTIPVDITKYESGVTVTILDNTGTLDRSGFTFAGWCVNSDGIGDSYTQGPTFTMGSSSITLYAKWSENSTYTVTYNGNSNTGGSVPVDNADYEQGVSVTVLGDTGNLKGEVITGAIYKAFLGWDTNASAIVAQYKADSTFNITSDTTLYAIYTALRVTGPAGGLIFYDAGSTQSWGRYLEAAPADITPGTGYIWKTENTNTSGTGDAIGTGAANMLVLAGTTYPAADACRNYSVPGFTSGWFLPSKDEIWQMCWNLRGLKKDSDTVQNPDVPFGGVGGFAASDYWSSTDTFDDDLTAWTQYFVNGHQNNYVKHVTLYVRAVRAF